MTRTELSEIMQRARGALRVLRSQATTEAALDRVDVIEAALRVFGTENERIAMLLERTTLEVMELEKRMQNPNGQGGKRVVRPNGSTNSTNRSACSYIENDSGMVLVVWNNKKKGWGLPGGKVEPGETIEHAQARELLEETGLKTVSRLHLYTAPWGPDHRVVSMFKVIPSGEPRGVEEGCPVMWRPRTTLIDDSPFAAYYLEAFKVLKWRTGVEERALKEGT